MTLTFATWHWGKVMTQLCERLRGPTWQLGGIHSDIGLGNVWNWPWRNQGYDIPSGHGQQLCEILSRSNRFWLCVHCDIGLRDLTCGVYLSRYHGHDNSLIIIIVYTILTMMRGWTLLIFNVMIQRSKSQWTSIELLEVTIWTQS